MTAKPIALALVAALLAVPAVAAENTLPPSTLTADGAWDCADPAGTYTGTVIVADKTYAFIKPNGQVGGYGELYPLDDTWWPQMVVRGGYLADEVGVHGLSLNGPREDYENFSGDLYLYAALYTERAKNWYCAQRLRAE